MSKEENKFIQGYACAVSVLIQMEREVTTTTRELFKTGLGNYDLKKFHKWNIDESDISVFKKHRKELIK